MLKLAMQPECLFGALLLNFLLVNYLHLTASYWACRHEAELAQAASQPLPDDDDDAL